MIRWCNVIWHTLHDTSTFYMNEKHLFYTNTFTFLHKTSLNLTQIFLCPYLYFTTYLMYYKMSIHDGLHCTRFPNSPSSSSSSSSLAVSLSLPCSPPSPRFFKGKAKEININHPHDWFVYSLCEDLWGQ